MAPVPRLHHDLQLLALPAGHAGRLVVRLGEFEREAERIAANVARFVINDGTAGPLGRNPFVDAMFDFTARIDPVGRIGADQSEEQQEGEEQPEARAAAFFNRLHETRIVPVIAHVGCMSLSSRVRP